MEEQDLDFMNVLLCALAQGDDEAITSSANPEPAQGSKFAAGQHRSTATRSIARSTSRKRRQESSSQKLSQLQREVDEKLQELHQAELKNSYLTERVRVYQIIAEVQTAQMQRAREVRSGLSQNPFVAMGITPQDLPNLTPEWLMQEFKRQCLNMATVLADSVKSPTSSGNLSDMLASHSARSRVMELRMSGGGSVSRSSSSHNVPDSTATGADQKPPGSDVSARLSTPPHSQLAQQQAGLQAPATGQYTPTPPGTCSEADDSTAHTFSAVDGLKRSMQYFYMMCPHSMLASSLHADAVLQSSVAAQPGAGAFMSLASELQQQPGSRQHAAANASNAATAPEEHWVKVIAAGNLSELQQLQSAILWEVVGGGITAARTERAQLAAALTQLMSSNIAVTQNRQHTTAAAAQAGSSTCSAQGSMAVAHQVLVRDPALIQQEAALLDKLQQTLVKERCLCILGAEVLFHHIIDHDQYAKMMLASYPFYPDEMALMYAAAAEYKPTGAAQPTD